MNNNSANVVEDGAVKLPIEEKYQKDISKMAQRHDGGNRAADRTGRDGSFPSQNVTQQYSSGAQKKINRIS